MRDVIERLRAIEANQKTIISLLQSAAIQEKTTTMTLAALKAQVDKNTSIEASAATLISGIASQMSVSKDDPAAIQALADELAQSGTALSAAIVANTPAAPPVVAPPVVNPPVTGEPAPPPPPPSA